MAHTAQPRPGAGARCRAHAQPRLQSPRAATAAMRYLEHGFPNPLVRWHYHEEYELHLIVATRGKVFVGDYIGQFEPGHLVLTGPAPAKNNWISTDARARRGFARHGAAVRRRAVAPGGCADSRAGRGAAAARARAPRREFFGLSEAARERFGACARRTAAAPGRIRHAARCWCAATTTGCSPPCSCRAFDDDAALAHISGIVDYLIEHYSESFSMAELAQRSGMTESSFAQLPPRHRQQLHRLRQPPAHQQGLPAC